MRRSFSRILLVLASTASVGLLTMAATAAGAATSHPSGHRLTASSVQPLASASKPLTIRTEPAHRSDPNEICSVDANGLLDECLNNWNNAYGAVRSYAPGVANNSFVVEGVDRCGHGDYTTSGCPVSGAPAGLFVYQIAYGNNRSDCIATQSTSTSNAVAGKCNGSNGYGGSYGTLFIAVHDGCPFSSTNAAINVFWTGHAGGWSAAAGIWWPEGNGNQVILSLPVTSGIPCLGYYPYTTSK